MSNYSGSKKKMNKWVTAGIIVFLVLVLIVGSVFSVALHILGRVDTQEREVQSDIAVIPDVVLDPEDVPIGYEIIEEYEIINADGIPIKSSKEVTNILLVGVDSNGNKGRSDTMLILSIDNKNKKLKLTSLLRDLYVTIPGRDKDDRLNHAYSYGGVDLLIRTVEYNFRVKIDKYVRVNFDTFARVINMLGGVDMELTGAEASTVRVGGSAGVYHLNGEQATIYARIRYLDSDFGRTNRQRKVITAVLNDLKKKDVKTLTSLMYDILPMVTTDYGSTELLGLVLKAPEFKDYEILTNRFPQNDNYRGVYIRGMAVLVTDLSVAAAELQEFIYG